MFLLLKTRFDPSEGGGYSCPPAVKRTNKAEQHRFPLLIQDYGSV